MSETLQQHCDANPREAVCICVGLTVEEAPECAQCGVAERAPVVKECYDTYTAYCNIAGHNCRHSSISSDVPQVTSFIGLPPTTTGNPVTSDVAPTASSQPIESATMSQAAPATSGQAPPGTSQLPPASTNPPEPVSTSPTEPVSTSSTEPASTGFAQPPQRSDSVLSTGAKAGIGVGVTLVAIAVAGLLFFLLRRRRNRHSYRSARLADTTGLAHSKEAYNSEKPGAYENYANGGSAVVGGAAVGGLAAGISQPAEDGAISGGMSKLRDKIKNHVQYFYHADEIAGNNLNESYLQSWSQASGISVATLKTRLLKPNTRQAALRSYIAWQILSRCNGEANDAPSLLPSQVSSIARNINSATGRDATTAIQRKNTASKDIRSDSVARDPSVGREIKLLLETMDPILRPFANAAQGSEQRIRNLESVMLRAAEFSFLLFSQPSLWSFDSSDTKQSEIVVMPALVQVVNEEGRALSPPKVFSHTEVA